MVKVLAILFLCFGWYDARTEMQPKTVTQPKQKVDFEYRYQGNRYYLKINDRTYWGYGTPKWMMNPYVR